MMAAIPFLRCWFSLGFGFGFPHADDAVAGFPLPTFFEQFDPLKPFQNVAFCAQHGGGA
jgi:hypothetical protein